MGGDIEDEGLSPAAALWSDLDAVEGSEPLLVKAFRGLWAKAWEAEDICSWEAWELASFATDVPDHSGVRRSEQVQRKRSSGYDRHCSSPPASDWQKKIPPKEFHAMHNIKVKITINELVSIIFLLKKKTAITFLGSWCCLFPQRKEGTISQSTVWQWKWNKHWHTYTVYVCALFSRYLILAEGILQQIVMDFYFCHGR